MSANDIRIINRASVKRPENNLIVKERVNPMIKLTKKYKISCGRLKPVPQQKDVPDPFNADPITVDNWNGFKRVYHKPIVVHACQMNFPEGFKVTTLAGVVVGRSGDYLIIGAKGERYTCTREIFEESYEEVKVQKIKEKKIKQEEKADGDNS